jgi:DNA invertase Pin-like site-specific DNA recombinase
LLLDGYIRVSRVGGRKGERFISPAVQREEIGRWISANGAAVGEMFEELDESGLRADRPLLMEAIERVERGVSDGIVVAKLNRFGRSLLDGLALIARIQKAGGTLVSVQQGFDLSTATGQLVTNILFAVAEWEVDQWRDHWDNARQKATERGIYICRRAPVGYLRTKRGHLEIDTIAGPVIGELFELRLAGPRVSELVDFLNASVVETESGRPFTKGSVYTVLRNPAYCGTAHSGSFTNPDAHEPIIDAASWQQCQRPVRTPRKPVEALVSGRIHCANCGAAMTAVRTRGGRTRTHVYRCGATPAECDRPAHACTDELDPLVEEFVFRHSQVGRPAGGDSKTKRHEAAVAAAREDLVGYRDNVALQRTLGPESFEAGLAKRASLLERKLLELARVKGAGEARQVDLARLECEWPELSWDQRRRAVGRLIDLVIVERGGAPLIKRTWIYKKGSGPVVRGRRRRIEFKRPLGEKMRLKEHQLWGEERIERELRAFFAERAKEWPSYLEFARPGHARLHAQVMAWGGPYYWAHRLELSISSWTVRWNHQNVEGALAAFLQGRRKWPSVTKFKAAGLNALYDAVRGHGGFAFWAERFGLPHEPRNDSPRRVWSPQRIERELRAFLSDREFFPTKATFFEEG